MVTRGMHFPTIVTQRKESFQNQLALPLEFKIITVSRMKNQINHVLLDICEVSLSGFRVIQTLDPDFCFCLSAIHRGRYRVN